MCMGCAGAVIINNHGKLPDTTETLLYVGAFALWIVLLIHFKKKLGIDIHNDKT